MTLPTPPEVEAYEVHSRQQGIIRDHMVERWAADAALAARTKQAEELAHELKAVRCALMLFDKRGSSDETTLALAAHLVERVRELERQENVFWCNVDLNEETIESLSPTINGAVMRFVPEAEVVRLRAMLNDAARFVNPFRLGRDRPSSVETTADVLAGLERRQTARDHGEPAT